MKEQSVRVPPIISDFILLAVAITVVASTFFEDDGQAYLFPKVVAAVMLITASVDFFVSRWKGAKEIILQRVAIRNFMPGFVMIIIFVTTAEIVGFYAISFAFILLTTYMYSAQIRKAILHREGTYLSSIMRDGIFATIFIIVIYLLFSILLQVQTPRGWML